MNQTLKKALTRIRDLPVKEQDRLAIVLEEFTQQSAKHETLLQDLEDPNYKAYVEAELLKGQADVEAGRITPVGEEATSLHGRHAGNRRLSGTH